jgi:hypothetical protein
MKIIRIETCADCPHSYMHATNGLDKDVRVCGNMDVYGERGSWEDRTVKPKRSPPSWCPLPEGVSRSPSETTTFTGSGKRTSRKGAKLTAASRESSRTSGSVEQGVLFA